MVRVGTYHEIFRQLLLDFKFKNAQYLDLFFARMLAYAILLNPYLHSVDKFVPIPLHWRRRLERTYNQSELLAHAVRAELRDSNLNIPVCMHLVRTRYTTPQSLLPTTERQNNLKGAFAVRPDIDFTNQHLCIIDDVTTTGTTLQTAARALKRAGAAKVSAAVLAVAEEK